MYDEHEHDHEIDVEHRLTAVEKLAGSNRHRLDEVERRQDNLDNIVSAVSVLQSEQKHIQTDVTEIKSDVKSLTEKPAKKWDSFVDKIVWAVAALLLGYFVAQFGLSL